MTRYTRIRHIDVTSRKNNKIEYLQRQVDNASTVVATAESKYNSFVEKATTFTNLYNEAEANYQTAEGYWKLFLQVQSDIKALSQTSNEANLVAVDAFQDVRQLIVAWEDVTADTLKAAEAIVLTSDYIQKRKASNPLISNDLVNDATAAASAAEKTVSAVIKAFTDALSTLSSSAQANNSTELTDVYINLAITVLLENTDSSGLLPLVLQNGNVNSEVANKIIDLTKKQDTLEASLSKSLSAASNQSNMALTASESANKEMNKAKEELAQAQAALATWEAALTAAETAVAG